MADLSSQFLGVTFPNPFILPSGIITEISQHQKAIEVGAGGITLKTLTKDKREGNPLPRVWKYEHGMLNSVGLRNPGIEEGIEEIQKLINIHKNIPVIVSLFSTKITEFTQLVERIVPLNPSCIELNLSCPNTVDELGISLGMEEGAAHKVITAVKKVSGKIPILAKLSPNVSDIAKIAKICEASGADGIVAINTIGPGMIIDIQKKRPILGNKEGGVSGPAILPIAIRCVYDIYDAVKIPIIGVGGVTKVEDALQMFMAGAALVGVGTATYLKGMNVFGELKRELKEYLEKENIKNIQELIGVAHSN